jgi:formylmethanofuran dehydrogenase subunit C
VSTLTLTQRAPTDQRLDLSGLTPERLAGLDSAQIARLEIHVGNRPVPVGELFRIDGRVGPTLSIVPAADNLDGLGTGMRQGELHVDGNAGRRAAAGLAGGSVFIAGAAGDEAGSGMSGGRLTIGGDAGVRLGGPTAGSTQGMSGGVILVHGSAGARAGERLRRGTIVVAGDGGNDAGVNMIAGTLAILGTAGRMTGSGMRRGTILLCRAPDSVPVTFVDNGVHHLSVMALLLGEVATMADIGPWAEPRPAHRLLGDIAEGGMGEILLPA